MYRSIVPYIYSDIVYIVYKSNSILISISKNIPIFIDKLDT